MPYTQAYNLLKNPEASLIELLESLQDLAIEYGYITGTASLGFREDPETDLVRILVLIQGIKLRIQQTYYS